MIAVASLVAYVWGRRDGWNACVSKVNKMVAEHAAAQLAQYKGESYDG